ncbi:unnamed protein product [Closterium sp. Naga37s-1]|nr:unnamed protein product [Closterium sp. Naga37s-1]
MAPHLYCVCPAALHISTAVRTAYLNGGPVCCVWFWWITAFFAHLLALSFAEIASSFPTAGSLYFWAAALAGPKYGPFAAWITGWLEFVGVSVGVGGVAFGGIQQIMSLVLLATGGGANGGGYNFPDYLKFLSCGANGGGYIFPDYLQFLACGANGGGYIFPDYLQFLACVALILVCAAINVLPIKRVGQVLAVGTVLQADMQFLACVALILVCAAINVLPIKRVGQVLAVGTVLQWHWCLFIVTRSAGTFTLIILFCPHLISLFLPASPPLFHQILVALVFMITLPAAAFTRTLVFHLCLFPCSCFVLPPPYLLHPDSGGIRVHNHAPCRRRDPSASLVGVRAL